MTNTLTGYVEETFGGYSRADERKSLRRELTGIFAHALGKAIEGGTIEHALDDLELVEGYILGETD